MSLPMMGKTWPCHCKDVEDSLCALGISESAHPRLHSRPPRETTSARCKPYLLMRYGSQLTNDGYQAPSSSESIWPGSGERPEFGTIPRFDPGTGESRTPIRPGSGVGARGLNSHLAWPGSAGAEPASENPP
jgi:hypothetical protein